MYNINHQAISRQLSRLKRKSYRLPRMPLFVRHSFWKTQTFCHWYAKKLSASWARKRRSRGKHRLQQILKMPSKIMLRITSNKQVRYDAKSSVKVSSVPCNTSKSKSDMHPCTALSRHIFAFCRCIHCTFHIIISFEYLAHSKEATCTKSLLTTDATKATTLNHCGQCKFNKGKSKYKVRKRIHLFYTLFHWTKCYERGYGVVPP